MKNDGRSKDGLRKVTRAIFGLGSPYELAVEILKRCLEHSASHVDQKSGSKKKKKSSKTYSV